MAACDAVPAAVDVRAGESVSLGLLATREAPRVAVEGVVELKTWVGSAGLPTIRRQPQPQEPPQTPWRARLPPDRRSLGRTVTSRRRRAWRLCLTGECVSALAKARHRRAMRLVRCSGRRPTAIRWPRPSDQWVWPRGRRLSRQRRGSPRSVPRGTSRQSISRPTVLKLDAAFVATAATLTAA